MPRKPNSEAPTIDVPTNEVALIVAADAQNQLAILNEQDAKNVKALAAQLNYKGATDPDSLELVCQVKSIAATQSIFELGASLLLLRESCLHGDWLTRLERLNISQPTANRYMTIATKFKGSDVQKALMNLGMGKLLELTAFDDGEVQAFIDGESVRGITIEAVQKLSLKEVRKELDEAKKETEAARQTSARLAARNAELETQLGTKIAADVDWPDALKPISDQIAACKRDIDHVFSKLETARIAVLQVEMPEDQRPKYEAALAHVAEVYASALVSAERHYLKDQVIFAQTLGAFLADGE